MIVVIPQQVRAMKCAVSFVKSPAQGLEPIDGLTVGEVVGMKMRKC